MPDLYPILWQTKLHRSRVTRTLVQRPLLLEQLTLVERVGAGERPTAPRAGDSKKSNGHLQQPKAVRFQFIEVNREEFEVQVMCDVLDVSRSGYYTWRTRPASQREMADTAYLKQIKQIYDDSHQTYGYARIWRELQHDGIPCVSIVRVG